MDRWLKVDPKRYVDVHEVKGPNGYRTSTSPFDIPQAMKAHVDAKALTLVIEFQYLTDERSSLSHELELPDGHVRLYTGVNSGRLVRVEQDVASDKLQPIKELLQQFESLSETLKTKPQGEMRSARLASAVIHDNAQKLVEAP